MYILYVHLLSVMFMRQTCVYIICAFIECKVGFIAIIVRFY